MAERRDGLQSGRDAAALVGDAVMLSVADLVSRLREAAPAAPAEAAPPPAAIAAPAAPVEADGPSGAHVPPGLGAATDALAAVVAAIVPAVISRIDLNEVVDRVDVQRIVDRVDVEQIVARIDLDELAGRIDIDALIARVDMDALVRRVDLGAVTQQVLESVDIGEIVRDSTATIGTDIVDDGRLQAMRADALIARWVDRVLFRRTPRRTDLDGRAEAP